MTSEVKALWKIGILGWILANATGNFTYSRQKNDYLMWRFENPEDAVIFRLKFGANGTD